MQQNELWMTWKNYLCSYLCPSSSSYWRAYTRGALPGCLNWLPVLLFLPNKLMEGRKVSRSWGLACEFGAWIIYLFSFLAQLPVFAFVVQNSLFDVWNVKECLAWVNNSIWCIWQCWHILKEDHIFSLSLAWTLESDWLILVLLLTAYMTINKLLSPDSSDFYLSNGVIGGYLIGLHKKYSELLHTKCLGDHLTLQSLNKQGLPRILLT